jgi:hypothetical protein
MTGIPPAPLADAMRHRTDPHPFTDWCLCPSCACGAVKRGIAFAVFSLVLLAGAAWRWITR